MCFDCKFAYFMSRVASFMTTNWQPSVLASFLMAVSARLVSFRQPASFMTTSWRPTRRCGGISHLGGRSQAGVHQTVASFMTASWRPTRRCGLSLMLAGSARFVFIRQPASFMTASWRPLRRCTGIHLASVQALIRIWSQIHHLQWISGNHKSVKCLFWHQV